MMDNTNIGPWREFNTVDCETELGSGAFGTVFRGRCADIDHPVAIKRINARLSESNNRRVLKELKAHSLARGPNIVHFYGYALIDRQLHIVMEFVPGSPLSQHKLYTSSQCAKMRAVPSLKGLNLMLQFLKVIGLQILDGLVAMEERGLVHRDLKPSNILIKDGETPVAKIGDLGLAKILGDSVKGTDAGARMGTPLYQSPEQIEDAADVDSRADLYSLGVMLREVYFGKNEFLRPKSHEILRAHLGSARISLAQGRKTDVAHDDSRGVLRALDMLVERQRDNRVFRASFLRALLNSGAGWVDRYAQWKVFVEQHWASIEGLVPLELTDPLFQYAEYLKQPKNVQGPSVTGRMR